MATKFVKCIPNANTLAWQQLDPSVQGNVTVTVSIPPGQHTEFVTNAVDVTAAGTESTGGRVFAAMAGVSNAFRLDPCKTWYRSSTATGGYTMYVSMDW